MTKVAIVFLLVPMQARLQMGASRKTIERPDWARFPGLAAPPRERTRWVKYKCRANERKVELAPTMPNAADIQRSLSCVNLVAPAARALPLHFHTWTKKKRLILPQR